MRRTALLLIVTLVIATALADAASSEQKAALAPGMLVFNSNRSGNHEIYVMQPDGTGRKALTHDQRYDSWWARVAPDRRHILFYRNPASKRKEDYAQTSLWMMAADGSEVAELRPAGTDGWAMQGHAEWSTDGRELVMFGGPRKANPQIFITDDHGRAPRQVTHRPGQNLDPSWSPDGQTIVFIGTPGAIAFGSDYEVYTVEREGDGKDAGTHEAVRHTFDNLRDHDPYFSPDGRHIAWLTQTAGLLAHPPAGEWSIRMAPVGGETDWGKEGVYKWVIHDGNINSYPAWFPDGARVAFHRLVLGEGKGFGLYAIGIDGVGLKALPREGNEISEYPAFAR